MKSPGLRHGRISQIAPRRNSRSLESPRSVSSYPQMGVNFAKKNKKVKNHRRIVARRQVGQSPAFPQLFALISKAAAKSAE
jgi:hypothetical protein